MLKVGKKTISGDSPALVVRTAISHLYKLDADRLPTVPPDLEEVRAWAILEVKRITEGMRGQYITLAPGKVGEYTQKRGEWEQWVAGGKAAKPDALLFPIATAEAVAYGLSPAELLAVWEKKVAAWKSAAATIATAERTALVTIEKATSIADIEVALVKLLS